MHWPVVAFDEIDSTNQEAQRRVSGSSLTATWILAKRQTAGRGRSGRSWQSTEGNLFASLLLPLDCPPNVLHHLSLLSGIAMHDAITSCCETKSTQADVRLKWPNDVLIDEAKVAGILVESSIVGDRAVAVIGFGVNLQSTPDLTDRQTTKLAAHGIVLSPDQFLEELDQALARTISGWDNGNRFPACRAR